MDLSIVIPLLNEEESLSPLFDWIMRVCDETYTYEVIAIDDGSSDRSWNVIETYNQQFPERIRGIKFRRNLGKSAALNAGFAKAIGNVVITMDADLQDSPDEIPQLYTMIMQDGFDVVSGWKQKRHDPLSKTIPSKFFNGVTRWVSGIPLHDFNCGLKAYRQSVVKSISIQGEMHRYIPVIAKQAGFTKIGEKVVEHRARQFGTTKFGLERFVNGFLDLLTVTFIARFGRRPMHFFGLWGVIAFLFGLGSTGVLVVQKLIELSNKVYGNLITNSFWFYLAITMMIIGVQLFVAGYLGELVARQKDSNESRFIEQEF